MKRSSKKLSLGTETLRSLTPAEMGDAAGGTLVGTAVCIRLTLNRCGSVVDACPSALGCTDRMSPVIKLSPVIKVGY